MVQCIPKRKVRSVKAELRKPRSLMDWFRVFRLYERSFPVSEKKSFHVIVHMYCKGKADVWCIRAHGRFCGLAITLNSPALILLDYLAVGEKYRGMGIGREAVRALDAQYADKGFFLEIESTLEAAENLSQRLRRKRFYLSCGLQELNARARLFGVSMELLGLRCHMDFDRYKAFYRDHYSQWAADHITPVDE